MDSNNIQNNEGATCRPDLAELPPTLTALSPNNTVVDIRNQVRPIVAEDTEVSLKTCQVQKPVCRNSDVVNDWEKFTSNLDNQNESAPVHDNPADTNPADVTTKMEISSQLEELNTNPSNQGEEDFEQDSWVNEQMNSADDVGKADSSLYFSISIRNEPEPAGDVLVSCSVGEGRGEVGDRGEMDDCTVPSVDTSEVSAIGGRVITPEVVSHAATVHPGNSSSCIIRETSSREANLDGAIDEKSSDESMPHLDESFDEKSLHKTMTKPAKNNETSSEVILDVSQNAIENSPLGEAAPAKAKMASSKKVKAGKEPRSMVSFVTPELNINSRPKRSTPHLSVFELLQGGELPGMSNKKRRESSPAGSVSTTYIINRDLRKMRSRFHLHYRIFTNFRIVCIFVFFRIFCIILLKFEKKKCFLNFFTIIRPNSTKNNFHTLYQTL